MQNPIPAVPNNEISEVSKQLEDVLKVLPQELLGVLPETVWVNLSLDQKKEILRQHNLFEKYNVAEQPQVVTETPVAEVKPEAQVPDVVVEQASRVEQIRTPEFAQALEAAREIEDKSKEDLPVADAKRIEEETATVQSTAKSSWGTKVFGYTVSEDTVSKSEELSAQGDVEDGRTWAATLLRKILAVLGQ
jgi:hypothetical protein